MQAAGEGRRVSSKDLQEVMDASSTLRLSFLRYVQSLQVQTQHTALANAQARLDRRLCR
ncbi:hypothetical protein SAMN04488020_109183 [Palleronia marisminoris]|nr:hypothetical protein SAMN04488020_109183 [Palleronia marisminoris]